MIVVLVERYREEENASQIGNGGISEIDGE